MLTNKYIVFFYLFFSRYSQPYAQYKNFVASTSNTKTSFVYDEILNKITTNGSISVPSITAGRWNGISNFNILIQNNLNIKDSIASIPEDSFALEVDNGAITLK